MLRWIESNRCKEGLKLSWFFKKGFVQELCYVVYTIVLDSRPSWDYMATFSSQRLWRETQYWLQRFSLCHPRTRNVDYVFHGVYGYVCDYTDAWFKTEFCRKTAWYLLCQLSFHVWLFSYSNKELFCLNEPIRIPFINYLGVFVLAGILYVVRIVKMAF